MSYNYIDDLSEKGRKVYNWVCDFVGERLEVSQHPWYGLVAYLDTNKLNIDEDMLNTINNEFYKHSKDWGFNMISAESGKWGVGDIYCISFDEKYKINFYELKDKIDSFLKNNDIDNFYADDKFYDIRFYESKDGITISIYCLDDTLDSLYKTINKNLKSKDIKISQTPNEITLSVNTSDLDFSSDNEIFDYFTDLILNIVEMIYKNIL